MQFLSVSRCAAEEERKAERALRQTNLNFYKNIVIGSLYVQKRTIKCRLEELYESTHSTNVQIEIVG